MLRRYWIVVLACAGVACSQQEPASTVPVADETAVATTTVPPAPTETRIERQVRKRREILTTGYFLIQAVVEEPTTERYQAYVGRYFRFAPDGAFAMHEESGGVVYAGTWSYERLGNKQHYLTLDAEDDRFDDRYRFHVSRKDIVFVGTETYGNTGLQMRSTQVLAPPFVSSPR